MRQDAGGLERGGIGGAEALTGDRTLVEPTRNASWPTVVAAALFVVATVGLAWTSSWPQGMRELGIAAILGSFAWLLGVVVGWMIGGALRWRSLGRGALAAVACTAGPIVALGYLLGASP